jgi:hypothetical protein
MKKSHDETSRRKFLELLAGSSLLQYAAVPGMLFGETLVASAAESPATAFEISTPAQALSVFDLEDIAREPAAGPLCHLATGVEADGTVRAARGSRSSRFARVGWWIHRESTRQ